MVARPPQYMGQDPRNQEELKLRTGWGGDLLPPSVRVGQLVQAPALLYGLERPQLSKLLSSLDQGGNTFERQR